MRGNLHRLSYCFNSFSTLNLGSPLWTWNNSSDLQLIQFLQRCPQYSQHGIKKGLWKLTINITLEQCHSCFKQVPYHSNSSTTTNSKATNP